MLRCACYARYSSDLQRDTSLEDQLRNCREYAERHGWHWQDTHIFTDAGISGASIEGRTGIHALLAAATTRPRPFDVLLVDDSSRIARDLADALRVLQRLRFDGVRVIYISQNIDSDNEQAETLVAVHGLVDGLYLREMAQKTRRGLRGQLARGMATGGITYGYKSTPIPDPNKPGEKVGCKIDIEPTEADIVRQVFSWYADGVPFADIITRLHEGRAPVPRGGGARGAWHVGAIRRMLANPKYRGVQVWGRTRTERKPGSRAVVARSVPSNEWHTLERPDLRIVDDDLWQRVQARRHTIHAALTAYRQPGRALLRGRPATVGHRASLFSGFLTCALCGKSISVVKCSHVKGVSYRYFGCLAYEKGGPTACRNSVTARVEVAEPALLAGLQAELLKPETVEYVAAQLADALRAAVDQRPSQLAALTDRREAVSAKIRNLLAAVESGTASSTIIRALQEREAEAARLHSEIAALAEPIDDHRLAVMPTWVRQQLEHVAGLLYEVPDRARAEFERLRLRFTFHPVFDVEPGQRPYLRAVGEGEFEHLTGSGPVFTTSDRSPPPRAPQTALRRPWRSPAARPPSRR